MTIGQMHPRTWLLILAGMCQIYLTLRDEDGDGKPKGEICWSSPGGTLLQAITGSAYQFDDWDGRTPLIT